MKLLGLNMFQPDTAVGILNMQIQSDWASRNITTEKETNETPATPLLTATPVDSDGGNDPDSKR
jgi:hypothetical protein